MVIGIDIDEILADFVSVFAEAHNRRYGTSLKKSDFHSYNFHDVLGGTREEAIQKVHSLTDEQVGGLQPVSGSIQAIRALKDAGHELHVITARRDAIAQSTKQWLAAHFPDAFAGVHFGNHYSQEMRVRKADLCKRAGVEVLIEDDLAHATDAAHEGIPILLMDYPWNQKFLPQGIQRVFSWEEIVEIIRTWPAA